MQRAGPLSALAGTARAVPLPAPAPGAGRGGGHVLWAHPGPLQIPGTLLVCAWLRGNIVAGAWPRSIPTLTTVPLYALAFYLGALVMPGEQTLPAWSSVAPAGFSVQALATWMQALGTPLLVGLPALAALMAVLGCVAVQLMWLTPPCRERKRRWARGR